jgi:hypothetical protein
MTGCARGFGRHITRDTGEYQSAQPSRSRPKRFTGKAIRLENHPLPIAALSGGLIAHRKFQPQPSRQCNVGA